MAELYGVETKRVNEAVRNNREKFPDGYVIELSYNEKKELVEKNDRFDSLKHSTVTPKAFTEKGLYMLATILKSPIATQATLAIVETFAKIRVLSRGIEQVNYNVAHGLETVDGENKKLQELMSEVLTNNLPMKIRKIGFSLNFGIVKFSVESTFEKKD